MKNSQPRQPAGTKHSLFIRIKSADLTAYSSQQMRVGAVIDECESSNIKTTIVGGVTMRSVLGETTADELLNALRNFYEGQITQDVIWDLTKGSLQLLTDNDMRRIAKFVFSHAHKRLGRKTAIVAPTDIEFGMSRMINTYGDLADLPFETRTFRTLSDAAEWIGLDLSELSGTSNRP